MNNNDLLTVNVQQKAYHTDEVAVLELVHPEGKALPPFTAGSHIDVHLGDGLVRQYSLCGSPVQQSVYRLGVLQTPDSRGGSKKVCQTLQVGDSLSVSLPKNLFPLNEQAEESLLIGGGIGITPMIAMAYALQQTNKPFRLHYCCRSRQQAAFLDELTETFDEQLQLHFDDLADEQRLQLERDIGAFEPSKHLYVCGPTGFMQWLIDYAEKVGFPKENIHYEYFDATVEVTGNAFEVIAESSGKTVAVGENQSIVEALSNAGIDVDISCEKGICGTCICDVLSGIPDHRDHFLTDEEKADNDQIAVCCSRAKSPILVLDI